MADLPIIDRMYEFTLWLKQRVRRFPRDQRFSLGLRMEERAMEVLDTLVEARYAADREPMLRHANLRLQSLRYQVRMTYDLKLIDLRRYEQAAVSLEDVGRQLGAWLRTSTARPGRPAAVR